MVRFAHVRVLFVFLICLLTLSCNEDTIKPKLLGTIQGTVVSSDSNKPLSGVSITTNPGTSAIVTDSTGKFMIENAEEGTYAVSAKKTGYRSETVNISVKEDKTVEVSVVLEKTKEGNAVPTIPVNAKPANEGVVQKNPAILKWKSTDANKDDTLTYDVFLFESGSPQKKKIASDIKADSIVVPDLRFSTTYFWQVIVKDNKGAEVSSPVWSFTTGAFPEYRYLFTRLVDGNYDVYISNGNEASNVKLTTGFAREWWPRLNPQRDIIAYSSNVGVEPQIYTMNRDGSNKRQITALPIAGYHNQGIGFAWSPDGGKLLYANYDKLYTVNRDGSGLTLIAVAPENRHFRMADWTAEGNKIVVQTIGSNINNSELYLMNGNGSGMQLLLRDLPGRIESPSFSIDGKSILYTQDVSGFENAEGRQLDARIYLKKLDGSSLIDLSAYKPAGTNDLYPRFSPDGSKVIFVNTSNDGISQKDVWTVDVADPRIRTKLFSNAEMPEWK